MIGNNSFFQSLITQTLVMKVVASSKFQSECESNFITNLPVWKTAWCHWVWLVMTICVIVVIIPSSFSKLLQLLQLHYSNIKKEGDLESTGAVNKMWKIQDGEITHPSLNVLLKPFLFVLQTEIKVFPKLKLTPRFSSICDTMKPFSKHTGWYTIKIHTAVYQRTWHTPNDTHLENQYSKWT